MDDNPLFGDGLDFSSDEELSTVDRSFQPQEDFLRQKASWIPKTENRQVVVQIEETNEGIIAIYEY